MLFCFCCILQVIFTNESNIERWKNKRQVAVDSKIGRLNNFIEKVKVAVQVNFFGTADVSAVINNSIMDYWFC